MNYEYLSKKISKNKILRSDLGFLKVKNKDFQDANNEFTLSEQI